jgi:hypothetical protein
MDWRSPENLNAVYTSRFTNGTARFHGYSFPTTGVYGGGSLFLGQGSGKDLCVVDYVRFVIFV